MDNFRVIYRILRYIERSMDRKVRRRIKRCPPIDRRVILWPKRIVVNGHET